MNQITKPKKINLCDPTLGVEEQQAVVQVLQEGWLTQGERVQNFEKQFSEMHGLPDAVAVSNCTVGLHLVMLALGIGSEDEVLIPSLSFVATANAVRYVGAKPVFLDLEALEKPHMSLENARLALTSRTKAVIVMHYAGYLVDLDAWRAFCDQHELLLVEDAAHSPGIRPVGMLSDGSAFSFFSNKNMTTGEGGMVSSRNPAVLEQARLMRSHGMTTSTLDRHKGHAFSYDVTRVGHNFRMDEMRAAIGMVQLGRLPAGNSRRGEISALYRELLAQHCPEVRMTFTADHPSAYHLCSLLLPANCDRIHVMRVLREAGVQSSIHYPPIHGFACYQPFLPTWSLAKTEQFCARELTLPLSPNLQDGDVAYVVEHLGKALEVSGRGL